MPPSLSGSYISQGESNTFTSQTSLSTNAFKREKKNKSPFKKNIFKIEDAKPRPSNYAYQTHQTQQTQQPAGLSQEIYTAKDTSARRQKSPGERSQSSGRSNYGDAEHLFDQNTKDNVKVVVRVRPLNERERNTGVGKQRCVNVDSGTIILDRGLDMKQFNFDFVGQEDIDQVTMFNHIAKPIADSCIQGYNGTIFAYGQTGSGKTYTIQGPILEDGATDNNFRGLMQRSFEYIFQNIDEQKKLIKDKNDGSEISYLIKCNYLEIYNEQIVDLLEPASINLHVREDIKKGVYVEGLNEEVVNSYKDMICLIQRGAKNRHVGSTAMNRESSRSHSVLTTIIESKSMSSTGVWNMKTSRFHIIDLAGSERSKNTNAVGERLKEAGMINKSLSALGNVINSLVDISSGKERHIPYRDSKLTFILRDSLGGNSKTVIIANISPSVINLGETLSTLEFARRAKQIKNRAVVNEDSSGTLLILKNEIKRLKKEMNDQNKLYMQLVQDKQLWETSSQRTDSATCKVCKTNLLFEKAERTADDNTVSCDDSLLLEGLKSDRSTPRPQGTFDKLKQAESLLAANLEALSKQKKFFDFELKQANEQIAQLKETVETLNIQIMRDKMKLKLREDKITKLEQEHKIHPDEAHQQLLEEIKVLNEELAHEKQETTNPKIQKLSNDLKMALEAKAQLERELNPELYPASLHKQLQDQGQLIDSLSDYLKKHASEQAIEQKNTLISQLKVQVAQGQETELKLKEAQDELQTQYDLLLTQNVSSVEESQKLTMELSRAKVENKDLNHRIAKFKSELDSRAQAQTVAENIKAELDLQVLALTKQAESDAARLQASTDQIKSLENEIQEMQGDLTLKEQLLETKSEHAQALQDEIEKYKTQITDYQTKLMDLKKDNEDALAVKDDQLKQTGQVVSSQREQLKALTEQISSLKEAMTEKSGEFDEHVQELSQKLSDQQKKIEEKEIEIDELKKRHQEAARGLQELLDEAKQEAQNEGQRLNEQIESQKAELDTRTTEVEALTDHVLKLEETLALRSKELDQALHDKRAKVESYENQILGLKQNQIKEMHDKESELIELKKQVEHSTHQHQALGAECNSYIDQTSQLKQKLNDLEAKLVEKEAQLAEQKSVGKNLMVQVEQEHMEKTKIQKDVKEFHDSISTLKSNIETLLAENKSLKQRSKDQTVEYQGKETDFKDELKQLKTNLNEQQTLITSLQQTKHELQTKLELVEATRLILEKEVESTKSDYKAKLQDKITKMESQVEEQRQAMTQKHNQQLQKIVEELQIMKSDGEKLIKYQTQVQELQILNQKQEEQIQDGNQRIGEMEAQLRLVESKLKQTQADLASKAVEFDSLIKRQSEQQNNISYLDESILEMNQTLNLKDNEMQELQRVFAEREEVVEELKRKVMELKEENQACRDLLKEKNEQTEGAEQEQAETNTLLIEAQEILNQKFAECEKLKIKNDSLLVEVTNMTSEIERLRSELDDASAGLEQAEARANELTEKHEDLANKLEDATQQNLQLEGDSQALAQAEHQLADLSTQLKQAQDQLDQTKQVLKSREQELHLAQEAQEETIEALAKAEAELTELKQKSQSEEGEAKSFAQRLNEATYKVEKAKSKESLMSKEIDMLRVQLNDVNEEKMQIESLCKQQMKVYEEKLKELSQKYQQAQCEVTELKVKGASQSAQEASSKQQLEQRLQERESELETANVEIIQLSDQIQTLERQLQQAAKESKELQSSFTQANNEHNQKYANLLQEVQEMQAYIEDQQDRIERLEAEAKELESVKQGCYSKIRFIQDNSSDQSGPEDPKKVLESQICKIVAELSDVAEISNPEKNDVNSIKNGHKSIEINLLISQIICGLSKLYEKQIVLERQKAADNSRRWQDKCERVKADMKSLRSQTLQSSNERSAKKSSNESTVDDAIDLKFFEDVQKMLSEERLKREEVEQELERYKVYLPEAENLLKEVNTRHRGAYEEINVLQKELENHRKVIDEYEAEIVDLNKKLKQLKKTHQIYEVRMSSQEQEIEQHQIRYSEVEQKLKAETKAHEDLQSQVQLLLKSTKHAKQDRDLAKKQMLDLQQHVELVKEADSFQKQEIKSLKEKVVQREQEMAEAVKSLKQFSEANRWLEAETERLSQELENQAGHKNPNQKIQLHLKIKEENNRLREDNLRLQEDLQKKIEIIQRHQKDLRTQLLQDNPLSPQSGKGKAELSRLIQHITMLPQLERLARQQNITLDEGTSLPVLMELISQVDERLEAHNESLGQKRTKAPEEEKLTSHRMMPPRAPSGYVSGGTQSNNTSYASQASKSKLSATQKFKSPAPPDHSQKQQIVSLQHSIRTGSQSKLATIQDEGKPKSRIGMVADSIQIKSSSQLANLLREGSPVMLNSYSSMYKQQNREKSRGASGQRPTDMQPEKESSRPNNYGDIINRQKQFKQQMNRYQNFQ